MAVTFHPDGRVMHNGVNMTPTQMVDQWRVPATFNVSGNIYITSWERNDSSGFANIGAGMSHSSGTFTFPSTGIYLIGINGTGNSDGGGFNYVRISITVTVNDSSYLEVAGAYQGLESNNHHWAAATQHIFDVTDTSTHKVKFQIQGSNTRPMCYGDTNANRTVALFTRLGDT